MPIDTHNHRRTILACANCHSPNVHVAAWVHANTNKVQDDEPPCDTTWCCACGTCYED